MQFRHLPIALALAAFAMSASADMIFKGDNVTLRLTMQPCPALVSEQIKEEYRAGFHSSPIIMDGKRVMACWYPHSQDKVFVKFEDGSYLTVPFEAVERDVGV